jgi:tetratricopeptide (TPR) repeat protein
MINNLWLNYYNKGLKLVSENDLTNGLAYLIKAAVLSSDDVQPVNLAGLILWRIGALDIASNYFDKSLKIRSDDNSAFIYKSELDEIILKSKPLYVNMIEFISLKDYKAAYELMTHELGLLVNDTVYYYNIKGLLCCKLNYIDEAISVFKKCLEIDIEEKNAAIYLRMCYEIKIDGSKQSSIKGWSILNTLKRMVGLNNR